MIQAPEGARLFGQLAIPLTNKIIKATRVSFKLTHFHLVGNNAGRRNGELVKWRVGEMAS